MVEPKRVPDESNPEPNEDAPMHVSRQSWMSNGRGDGDFGLARGIAALLAWRKRRKKRKER